MVIKMMISISPSVAAAVHRHCSLPVSDTGTGSRVHWQDCQWRVCQWAGRTPAGLAAGPERQPASAYGLRVLRVVWLGIVQWPHWHERLRRNDLEPLPGVVSGYH